MITPALKMTINKPAADVALRGAPFVTFRLAADGVQVRGSDSGPAADTFAAERRQAGGAVIMVVGEAATRLRAALHPTAAQPFRALHAVDADAQWFRLAEAVGSIARHIPALRVWLAVTSLETARPAPDAEALVSALREAEVVLKHQTAGRPTREAAAARDLMRAFDAEAYRMGWVKGDVTPIFEAINLLEAYAESLLGHRRTTRATIAQVRTAIRFAEHTDIEELQKLLLNFLIWCRLHHPRGCF